MLRHLDEDVDLREIDLGNKPEEFVRLSPTGKVPMLVHDDFVLYESQVINDYLAEELGWNQAYASDRRLRYRQKVCMKQWDTTVLEAAYASLSDPERLSETWGDLLPELEYLAKVVDDSGNETRNLLAYHVAPFWGRFRWLEEYTDFPEKLRGVDGLGDWLDRTVDEPEIEETLPEREYALKVYRKHYINQPNGA